MGFGSNPIRTARSSSAAKSAYVGELSAVLDVSGDDRVRAMFAGLPEQVVSRVMRPLMKEASRMVAAEIKDEAPRDSGLMALAVGATATKRYGKYTLFAAAGVRRGYRRAVVRTRGGRVRKLSKAKSESADGGQFRDPAKYLHLVTRGRKAVDALSAKSLYSAQSGKFFGRHARRTDPNPFVERAFASVQSRVTSMVLSKAPDLIEMESAKLAGG